MLLSCRIRVLEWICTLPFPKCSRVPALNRSDTWRFSDRNRIQSHNLTVCKITLNSLSKWATWLSCVAAIYLHGAFDYVFLSFNIHVLDWIYILQLLADTSKMYVGLNLFAARYSSCFVQKFIDIQTPTDCKFTLIRMCDMIENTQHCTGKYLQHGSTILPVSINDWVFL